jgi:hypothetical protein
MWSSSAERPKALEQSRASLRSGPDRPPCRRRIAPLRCPPSKYFSGGSRRHAGCSAGVMGEAGGNQGAQRPGVASAEGDTAGVPRLTCTGRSRSPSWRSQRGVAPVPVGHLARTPQRHSKTVVCFEHALAPSTHAERIRQTRLAIPPRKSEHAFPAPATLQGRRRMVGRHRSSRPPQRSLGHLAILIVVRVSAPISRSGRGATLHSNLSKHLHRAQGKESPCCRT